MEKIASFQVDHTRLTPGMYTSRTDGDVVTYDVRFIIPIPRRIWILPSSIPSNTWLPPMCATVLIRTG